MSDVSHLCGLESSAHGVGQFDKRAEYFPLASLFHVCILSMPFSLVYGVQERDSCYEFWLYYGFQSIRNLEQGFKIF